MIAKEKRERKLRIARAKKEEKIKEQERIERRKIEENEYKIRLAKKKKEKENLIAKKKKEKEIKIAERIKKAKSFGFVNIPKNVPYFEHYGVIRSIPEGIYLDDETHLAWVDTGKFIVGRRSINKAITYCKNLTLGNVTDWRLPTAEELKDLSDFKKSHHLLSDAWRHEDWYWSSSLYKGKQAIVMSNGAYVGDIDGAKTGSLNYVRCVRGKISKEEKVRRAKEKKDEQIKIANERIILEKENKDKKNQSAEKLKKAKSFGFVNIPKDVYLDDATHLAWQDSIDVRNVKKQMTSDANWKAKNFLNTDGDTATTYCKKLTLGNVTDWRLPTKIELQNLVPKNSKLQYGAYRKEYWCSTSVNGTSYLAWTVHFPSGSAFKHSKGYWNGFDNKYYVRCVRDGEKIDGEKTAKEKRNKEIKPEEGGKDKKVNLADKLNKALPFGLSNIIKFK